MSVKSNARTAVTALFWLMLAAVVIACLPEIIALIVGVIMFVIDLVCLGLVIVLAFGIVDLLVRAVVGADYDFDDDNDSTTKYYRFS